MAFQDGLTPQLSKFTVDAEDILHEHRVLQTLWSDPPVPRIVGPVKLLHFKKGSVVTNNNNGERSTCAMHVEQRAHSICS